MNYYDALLQHRQRIEDVERQQENARHLRDSQRTQDDDKSRGPKRVSALVRLMTDAKDALMSLNRISQKRVIHAGHTAAIKDVTC